MISTKYYPNFFKRTKMIFIHKPGTDPHDPVNYRPISLLEILGKIFEKIISTRLTYFFEYNNLFNENQFGFRGSRSTQHAINNITEVINENKKQDQITLIATRDVHKAFDTLWHKGLIYKLSKLYNLDIEFISLIYNYLKGRWAIPHFANSEGPKILINAGVPQGSCLGPVLYLIYVNDTPKTVYNDTIISQFADDKIHIIRATGSTFAKKVEKAIRKIITELQHTQEWEAKWKIKTNSNKSSIMPIGCTVGKIEEYGGVTVNNNPIKITNKLKILGVTLDNKKQCTQHINYLLHNATYNLQKLYSFKTAPTKIKLSLYKSLIRPLIEYPCLQILNSGITNIKKLQGIQNKALRYIHNIKLSDKVKNEKLHQLSKIDPINIRISKLSRKFCHKLRELYFPEEGDISNTIYKLSYLSEYTIENNPIKSKKPSVSQSINENIIINHRKYNILNIPQGWDEWILPNPVFNA